ncbi:hypothetical protein RJI07_06160 [Mycoplasmatota bacterium WC30]
MKKASMFLLLFVCSLMIFSCSARFNENRSFSVVDEEENLTYIFYDFELKEVSYSIDDDSTNFHCLVFKARIENDTAEIYSIYKSYVFRVNKDDVYYSTHFLPISIYAPIITTDESSIEANGYIIGEVVLILTKEEPISDFGIYTIEFLDNYFYVDIESSNSVSYAADYEPQYTTRTEYVDSCSYSISIEVANGLEQIETQFVNCLAYGTKPENEFTADGICGTYDMVTHLDDFQTIEQTENMTLIKNSGSVGSISVYNTEGTLLETWDSWEERGLLSTGQYIIMLNASKTEQTCYISGHSYFVLNVS